MSVMLSPLTRKEFTYKQLKLLQTLLGSVPLVHVDDVCEAHIFCMENTANISGRFICASAYPTVNEIVTRYEHEYPDTVILKEDVGEEIGIGCSSSKLIEMGFAYKYSTEQILLGSVAAAPPCQTNTKLLPSKNLWHPSAFHGHRSAASHPNPSRARTLPFPRRSSVQPPANHPKIKSLKNRLTRLTDSGRLDDALSTLDLMAEHGVTADLRTYSALLRSCIRSGDLHHGRLLHRHCLLSGLPFDSILSNSLITLYSKCGDWASAFSVFNKMGDRRDIVSWTALISAAAKSKMHDTAVSIFLQMLELGFVPNEFTISSVIQACSIPQFLQFGTSLLGSAIKNGYCKHNASVAGALIDMFAKNGDMVSAHKVFDEIPDRNEVLWTLLITRYAQHGLGLDAVKLFVDLLVDDCIPDPFSLSSVISACAESGSDRVGKQLHALSIQIGLDSDVCVGCSLVDMYAKCSERGSIDDSRKVFDRMPVHNVMSWTAIISGYAQSGGADVDQPLILFSEMLEGMVKPNEFTYSSVLKACTNLSKVDLGLQVHAHIVKSGLSSVNFVGNALVTMFASSGRMDDACKAFELLYEKNLISYNALVDGYAKSSNSEEAIEIFHRIESSDLGASAFTFASLLSAVACIGLIGKGQQFHGRLLKMGFGSDTCVANALITMYSRCGNVDDACIIFGEMNERNVISWTSMIAGLAKHGDARRALQLFNEMLSAGLRPNEITYLAVLSACSHVGLVREGLDYFHSMERDRRLVARAEHYACVVDLLGRSGRVEEALEFVASMPFEADALVWKTLLGACRTHRKVELGEIAAKRIIELDPSDPAAYILLSNTYAAAGRWAEVARIRRGMKERGLSKEAGLSWIEIGGRMHKFHVADTGHPQSERIFKKLGEVVDEIKGMGYVPDTDCVLHDVGDDAKEKYLLQHSEKMAVAFGLLSTAPPCPIRVLKNLRVCGDCHAAIMLISKATHREIILRDSSRFHRFVNGECSCGGYW
ncbi:Pentatricopeptide repeat-containing protein [Platanthera zijinensis]|uniref:Pentatricopeptide repeat-containing protein n=1 Tax=Platanthera zijinensis TaxID=2320716 RepID=A0AAP0BCH4_9ASPA